MAATTPAMDLPLFPLSNVLFPGGQLQLRIFEPRYVDLVRECARTGRAFGVCLILDGREAGQPAVPAAVGTLATITDFHSREDGLLGIVAEGGQRFRVTRTRVRADGQMRGDLAPWADEPLLPLPAEFGLLGTILERLAEQMQPPWRHEIGTRGDDASWVGFRLSELLPLDANECQHMLELDDPLQRLAELRDILPRFQRA
ncbi:LON peptidase substrate-binding domain-containing protein [Luteibacter sp. 9135]|uniref:LON peptidase substrate-binding domain-containing protein n=1 Tax=Luteibacter sp. 9135 TaxID=1500893 RepID=UPI00055F1FC0|nr:LON peptidase substrate-binding domain-containing protein [Luteibacter sp. 9135]